MPESIRFSTFPRTQPPPAFTAMLAAFRLPKLVCSFPDFLPSVRHLSSLRIHVIKVRGQAAAR